MSKDFGINCEQNVANILNNANIPFQKQTAIGGIRPDFLLKTPKGRVIIVEAKSWEPTQENQSRAILQSNYYKKATNADGVFFVVPGLKDSYPAEGLVSENELADVLYSELGKEKTSLESPVITHANKLIFAVMPYNEVYYDTFFNGMAGAAKCINAACERVDEMKFTGDVVEQTKKLLQKSFAVISDLSESNPNVLYETGIAHALGRRVILICSTPIDDLPFLVRNLKIIKYKIGQTCRLKEELANTLKIIENMNGEFL